MARCNIFRPLSKYTGEFLMFSQYTEDLTKESAQKTEYRVVPSKFAVFELDPAVIQERADSMQLNINTYISSIFQREFENANAFLRTERSDWNPEMSSALFWHTLETYILKEPKAFDLEPTTSEYEELRYVGPINIYNNHRYDGINYNEIYCYVPTSEPAYHYQLLPIGSKQLYEYKDKTLVGWLGNAYPQNLIIDNVPITESGFYSLGGSQIPNILCPLRDPESNPVELYAEENSIVAETDYFGEILVNITEFINRSESDDLIYTDSGKPVTEDSFKLDADHQKVRIESNKLVLRVDSFTDEDMTQGQKSITKHTVDGLTFELGENWIEFSAGTKNSYKFNMIVLFYDIYNDKTTEDGEAKLLYRNVPLGIYFTGCVKDGEFQNSVTKYVTNDDIFGQGSSYGLRVCTKFVGVPNSEFYEADVTRVADDYAEIASAMGKFSEAIDTMTSAVNIYNATHQDIKDHLALFKNYRVNVPYIREVNHKHVWFINGRNTEQYLEDIIKN